MRSMMMMMMRGRGGRTRTWSDGEEDGYTTDTRTDGRTDTRTDGRTDTRMESFVTPRGGDKKI